MKSVLFVCLGNICRSPTAEGVFRYLCEQAGVSSRVDIDSAGTGAWHVGHPPDVRAQAAALKRGIDLSQQRARAVSDADFEVFDYILAMDQANLQELLARSPTKHAHKIQLYMEFAQDATVAEVPDPYYGEGDGFERVLDLVMDAGKGLIRVL